MGNRQSTSTFKNDEKNILNIQIKKVNDFYSILEKNGYIPLEQKDLNTVIKCFPVEDENFFKYKWGRIIKSK